ncbi:hypothetical protein LSUE1_G005364 [Lachnellula suecica]|uniref:Uncharacterized protein n=1 Tax=Lachnellula suecica TaxID=602035 RepID=A0A8T9C0J6_9HELO|nr:hypothetical protein LSUE1_G005364 [Lachnellula suecica]
MAQSFEGEIVLVTSGSGIGRATSIKMVFLGATLAPQTSTKPPFSDPHFVPQLPTHSCHRTFHLSFRHQQLVFVVQISKYERINHIFNCAGINPTKCPTEDITDEYWDGS